MTGIVDIGTLKHETFSRRLPEYCSLALKANVVYPHLPFTSPASFTKLAKLGAGCRD